MRLIDADALKLPQGFFETVDNVPKFFEWLNEQPTADVVEVVRCKDCKYWHREIHNGIEYFNWSSCDLHHYGDGHNFYCADAKRRIDETN